MNKAVPDKRDSYYMTLELSETNLKGRKKMLKARLLRIVPESKKFIAANVIFQWISLIANIVMMTSIATLLADLFSSRESSRVGFTLTAAAAAIVVRFICTILSSRMSFLSSKAVKKTLRGKIYEKLLKLGASYNEQVRTSEIVQVAVEGVDQLETYFGAYVPQFFYALLAPLTLFIYLSGINMMSAIILLICVPLIPVAIAAVQTWAKKLLSKYWGQYTALGDTFLENLQGLTTLRIYQSDGFKNDEMNREAEKFRKITMKVLTMQLNSITIMDFIAYGGAALGMIIAVSQLKTGNVTLAGCILIILLAADFFIPMRQLGSFFHVAMNGMAASDKIFALLDLPEKPDGTAEFPKNSDIICEDVHFSYEPDREILHGVDIKLKNGAFTAIVGESGCGKSTISSILTGKNKGYSGSIRVGDTELSDISEKSLLKNVTYISHHSYLFKGTVRQNLLMGSKDADDNTLWELLERVNLADFLRSEEGLDTKLSEKASNLSGGQCQRLALARALLRDSPVYIFDEATSNIDVESENDILSEIHRLAKTKTVLMISHRLANITAADEIYVMEKGNIVGHGKHDELIESCPEYSKLWNAQQTLENYSGKESSAK